MSKKYTAVAGDTLRKISSKQLGNPFRWSDILDANQWLNDPERRKAQLDVGLPDREALFNAGEVFTIPTENEFIQTEFAGDRPDQYRIILKGPGRTYEVTTATELSEIRFMNTLANGFSFTVPWDNPDDDLVYLTREDGYYDAFLYIGGKLEYQCIVYSFARSATDSGGRINKITCFSPTADAVDSRVEPPYVYNQITLELLIKDNLSKPLAIPVDYEIDENAKFLQCKANNTDTIFSFLRKYANQRQGFLNSTYNGRCRVWRANVGADPVGTIKEGEQLPLGFTYNYDGRKRFTNYMGICQTPAGNLRQTVRDTRVPLTRKTMIELDGVTTNAELKKALEWHRNKTDAEAKKRTFPVVGLYAPNGELWTENTTVVIESATMGTPDGFTYLIEGIERKWTPSGITTDLHIVDPESLSNGDVSG